MLGLPKLSSFERRETFDVVQWVVATMLRISSMRVLYSERLSIDMKLSLWTPSPTYPSAGVSADNVNLNPNPTVGCRDHPAFFALSVSFLHLLVRYGSLNVRKNLEISSDYPT